MKVYFLGTGTSQGIPVIGSNHPVCKSTDTKDKRLRVSVWVEWDNTSIVIDCGPDFRQQMLTSKCERIDAILYTHEHADHTSGLDDIRPYVFKNGDMPIYAHKRVLENLERRFDYVFTTTNKYPGAPSVIPFEVIENQPFTIHDHQIIPIDADHAGLQVFGYRINDFAYLTDIKTISNEESEKLTNLKVLVINCLRDDPHPSHLNLTDAIKFIRLIAPEKAYLTHISHNFGFHEDIQKRLPENIFLAYDNLQITI